MVRHITWATTGAMTAAVLVAWAGAAWAQPQGASSPIGRVQVRTGVPQRDTMLKLMRPITVDLRDERLEAVITFIRDFSGADIEPMWVDDRNPVGLDKDKLITVSVSGRTVLALIEMVLDKAQSDFGGENTWQMSETGALQIGPKERLNRFRRVEIYDINDLLMEIPDYRDVPRIDLQQALQASQQRGGGSTQSPFRQEQEREEQRQREQDRQERGEAIIQLLQEFAERDQWVEQGGTGGTMRYYRGTIIVNAPDYMHRALNGYRWWPSSATVAMKVHDRRYVTLTTDNAIARLLGFGQQPVSAVVGGQIIRSNQPPGGGP